MKGRRGTSRRRSLAGVFGLVSLGRQVQSPQGSGLRLFCGKNNGSIQRDCDAWPSQLSVRVGRRRHCIC